MQSPAGRNPGNRRRSKPPPSLPRGGSAASPDNNPMRGLERPVSAQDTPS
jgi:hypothetical protein